MAVAAFKSSSRRGNPTTTNSNTAKVSRDTSPKKAPIRRSRSVSAFSRTSANNSTETSTTISSDFLNKRDNPLFWSSSTAKSPPELEPQCSNGGEDSRRGRSVTRNSGVGIGSNKGAGMEAARSLSSVGTAAARRNRSVSRGPVSRRWDVTSESEAEQEGNLSKDFKNRRDWSAVSNNTKKGGLVRSSSGVWSSRDSPFRHSDGSATTLSCSQSANREDKASTASSLSGAEDKTIKAVCGKMKSVQGDNVEADTTTSGIYETVRSEVRRAISEIQSDLEIAIRKSKTTAIVTTNIADIPPDLVNPDAVELVLDIRREYAIKLEQSLERARKLQADLAVEEHRGHELSRILKEILPDPKTPNVPKSRPGRKTSIERRKMSKRLEEEAMNYFDECVSLSTFDSSDFSSPEDPPFDLATPVGDSILPQASLGASATNFTKSSLNTKQESDIPGQFMNGDDASRLTASSDSKEPKLDPVSQDSANSKRSQKFQFTFAGKTTETFELQQDIKKYIRTFEKHDVVSENNRSNCYNMDEYNLQASAQSLLFDKVILKNRIESGSLLVCGGITVSFSPFAEDMLHGTAEISELSLRESKLERVTDDANHEEHEMLEGDFCLLKKGVNDNVVVPIDLDSEMVSAKRESSTANPEDCDIYVDDCSANKQVVERRLPNAVLPLLRYYQYESSESSSSFQGSPSEDRNFRSDADDTETEEASFSGQEYPSDLVDILEWAKANNHGPLQIICEYYRLHCPARGSTLRFHPLEHLHPLEYNRPDETVLHIAGSTINLRSCSTSLEFAEAHGALLVEEEASALSVWAIACICGSLRLENVLTLFAAALLEKQIVVVCSNLGILSASVLSIIPLIRPYQWQSLLMPVLPNDMLDFLDAPVPYIVGVKNKTNEVQSKLTNVILLDVNKNQVKSPSIPQLPQQRELFSLLSPYHAKLVGESYLGKKRPVYECTEVQVEAAKGFLAVLRSYLDSLCSNLRSHTITNVQSNDDKVSLLLKESFIDSFPSRDRPFMKLFVDTQLFSVHTDLVLSFIQKE